jgi:hypothetical protein
VLPRVEQQVEQDDDHVAVGLIFSPFDDHAHGMVVLGFGPLQLHPHYLWMEGVGLERKTFLLAFELFELGGQL